MKKNILLLFLFGICMSVNAQNVIEEFKKNHLLAGSQSVVYTVPTCKYTAAPKGYTPFYLSHYGRHGSRFHNGDVYKYTYNHEMYLQPIITQYFIDNKSEIWLLFLIAHSKR